MKTKIGCNRQTYLLVECLWIVNKVVKKSLSKNITQLVINTHHWQRIVNRHKQTDLKMYQTEHWENSFSIWVCSSWNSDLYPSKFQMRHLSFLSLQFPQKSFLLVLRHLNSSYVKTSFACKQFLKILSLYVSN